MRHQNYYIFAACMLLATSCKEDVTPGFTPATPGDEVVFAAKLNIDQTRTIYDGENADKTGLKINWTNKDYIAVASPQCMAGRQTGYYKVNIGDASSLNYAVSLDKQGETGVQWGNADKANFYAVYPAASANDIKVTGNSATANITVPSQQINFLPNNYSPSTDGATTSYVLNPDNNTMAGQFMYAQAKDQESGKPVELQFTPTATTLMIKFAGFENNNNIPADGVMIQNVTLTAPEGTNLAGSFNVEFNADAETAPSITADNTKGTSNSITATTLYQTADGNNGQYLSLKPGQSFSIKMLLNPVLSENLKIGEGWTISVKTVNNGIYSKALTAAETANTTLVAGKVHKMVLPTISVTQNAWTFEGNEKSWMAQIPHNVYVTELSLPGAWYAYDGEKNTPEGYQTTGIAKLFDAGVRAFHVETRVGLTGSSEGGNTALRSISDTDNQTNIANSTIVISGTGSNQKSKSTERNSYYNATSLDQTIKTIANKVANTEEYAVLAINYSDGGSAGVSAQWRGLWLSKLNTLISGLGVANIYKDKITPNTTIGEVRGKLILLVCVDNANEESTTLPTSLLAYTDMTWEASNLNNSLISPMQWNTWPGVANTTIDAINSNNLYLNYSIANRTYANREKTGGSAFNPQYTWSFTPTGTSEIATLEERKNAISTIIDNSAKIYAAGTHNVWYLIGAGGTLAPNKSDSSLDGGPSVIAGGSKAQNQNGVASGTINVVGLNDFLLEKVNTKLNGNEPSPVGLVFINQATNATYNGPALIKAIFDMNNKFYLNRAPEPTTQENAVRSASPNHASGFKVNSDSWTVF